jgi:hypothetical protein
MRHSFECPEIHNLVSARTSSNFNMKKLAPHAQSFANMPWYLKHLKRETVTLNFSDTPFLLGDDRKLSPSQSRRHIHADGLNGRRQASRLPVLVMASLPKHGTRRARAEKTYDGESLT